MNTQNLESLEYRLKKLSGDDMRYAWMAIRELINIKNNEQKITSFGWVCPVCGRGNSPYTNTCPCIHMPIIASTS